MKKIVFISLVITAAFIGTLFCANLWGNHTGHQATITNKVVMSSASLLNRVMTGFANPAWATDDPFANTAVANAPATLGATATGKLGKAIFFFVCAVGIFCLLFTKHRGFGLIVIVFGFLLGAYSGVVQGLWTAMGGQ